jgi:hypothetical protein
VILRWIFISIFLSTAILLLLFSTMAVYTRCTASNVHHYSLSEWMYLALMYFTSFVLILYAHGWYKKNEENAQLEHSGLLDDNLITPPNE